MRRIFICVSVIAMLSMATPTSAQLVVEQLGYEIVGEFPLPAGLTGELGDILFSADGLTVRFLDLSESEYSKVYTMSVMRYEGKVIGFNGLILEFSEPWMDTGLEFAPGSNTLFFRGWDPSVTGIGQRPVGGGIEYKPINNYAGDGGGLAFFPPTYSNAGNLVSPSYYDATIHMHAVTDDGDGTFTVADGTLFADFSALGLTTGIGDVEFYSSGSLADKLLIAFYDYTDEAVSFIDLDPSTGLPSEGSTPTLHPLLSGTTEVWGLGVDPTTGNIWVTIWTPTFEPYLIEIAGPLFADGFESDDVSMWSSAVGD